MRSSKITLVLVLLMSKTLQVLAHEKVHTIQSYDAPNMDWVLPLRTTVNLSIVNPFGSVVLMGTEEDMDRLPHMQVEAINSSEKAFQMHFDDPQPHQLRVRTTSDAQITAASHLKLDLVVKIPTNRLRHVKIQAKNDIYLSSLEQPNTTGADQWILTESTFGAIIINEILWKTGGIIAKTQQGKIFSTNTDAVQFLRTRTGTVHVQDCRDRMHIQSIHGNVQVVSFFSSLDITTQSGHTRIDQGHTPEQMIWFGIPTIQRRLGRIQVDGFNGKIHLPGADLSQVFINPAKKEPLPLVDITDSNGNVLVQPEHFRNCSNILNPQYFPLQLPRARTFIGLF